ncbi:MAG: hypothetical protein J6Y16_09655 [Treponema sp.]|nr:hypothetical protein [Treponema sp.]
MKGTRNFAREILGGLFILLSFVFGLTACQVGLGAAVDTSDPRAAVTIPTVADPYVGGETIHIAGTCEDDSGIAEIKIVQLKNVETGKEYNDLGSASLSETAREWSFDIVQSESSKTTYVLNDRELTLTDGKYLLTILPVDNGGRTPRYGVERTFEIDNTPPIFLISTPNSTNINDPASFGQTVKIKGDIYDDHDIKGIEVSVYSDTGDPKNIVATADITNARDKTKSNFEVIVAKKDSSSDANEATNYTTLYPSGVGDKKYYMDVVLEDTVNMGTDLPGNKTRFVYFKTPLLEKLRGAGVTKDNFTGNDLLRGYNGTSTVFTAEQCRIIQEVLDGTFDEDTSYYAKVTDRRLAFSVNPNNNPKYSFGGMAFSSSNPVTWSGRGAAGGSVTLMVSAGSDDALVKPDTIVVTLQPVNNSGNPDGTPQTLQVRKDDGSQPGSTPVDSATYTITLPEDLNGTYYKLTADGFDDQGHPLVANNGAGYGFMLYSNKLPVSISSTADLSYVPKATDNKYSFAISISDQNSPLSINKSNASIKYQIQTAQGYKTKQDFASSSWNTISPTAISGDNLGNGTSPFSLNLSNLAFTVDDDSVGTIALRIWGDNGVESEKNVYLLYVDNSKPVITVNNETELLHGTDYPSVANGPIHEGSSFYSASDGKYTISGSWQDVDGSGVKKLQYSTDDGNTWDDIGEEYTSRVTDKLNWTMKIDVEEGSGKKVYIKATDLKENEETVRYDNIKFDFGAPRFTSVATEKELLVEKEYVKSDATFTAVAIDGFGLDDILVTAKQNGSTVTTGQKGYSYTVANTAGSNKSKTATITMQPTTGSDGSWTFDLTARDLNGREASASFSFTVDHTAPIVKANSIKIQDATYNSEVWQKLPTAKITGTITEAISLETIYYKVENANSAPTNPADITSNNTGSVSYTNKNGDVGFTISVDGLVNNTTYPNTVYIQPVDKAGNKGPVTSYVINVDQNAPALDSVKYQIAGGTVENAAGIIAVNEKTLTLWGTYSDTCSGVKALGFAIDSSAVTPSSIKYTTETVTASNIATLADSAWNTYSTNDLKAASKNITGWKATFESGLFRNGTLKITGSDNAENSTTISSITLRKDNVKPTVSSVSIDGAYMKDATTYYVNNTNTQIAVKGVSSDDYSLKNTVITIPGYASSPITKEGTSWTTGNLNIAGLIGDSVTITVVANDTAGNISDEKTITLNFDTTAPSRKKANDVGYPGWGDPDINWRDTEFKIGGGNYNAESYSGSTTLDIQGSFIEEGSGIDSIYYELVNGTGAFTMTTANYKTNNKVKKIIPNSDGTFTTTLTGLQEGKNKLRIIAVDNVGNISKITDATDKYESDFVLGLDQTIPSFGDGFTLEDDDGYVSGNFTVSGGTVSDDKAGVNHDTLRFWLVEKNGTIHEIAGHKVDMGGWEEYDNVDTVNDESTGYKDVTTITNDVGTITYRANDKSNLSGTIEIQVTPDALWFTEAKLGSSPILYGSVLDYSNPGNNSGTTTILTTLKLDQTAPVIAIGNDLSTSPITDDNDGGKIKPDGDDYFYELTGTWKDLDGSGPDKLFYSINNGTDWINADTLATKNYVRKSTVESSWSLYIPVVEGSNYTFAVKAQDANGNTKEAKPGETVTFDFSKPTIEISLADGVYGETRPTVMITAHDHHRIKTTDGIVLVGTPKKNGANASASDYTLETTTGGGTSTATRTLTFNTDGVFKFTFKAVDVNNRESDTVEGTWTIDTVAPAPKADNVATYGLKINGAAAKTWYRDTNLRFDGYVDESLSGLKTVYYLVSANSTEDVADVVAADQWNFAGASNTGTVAYSVMPTVSSVNKYVHMVFEDVAGNKSAVKTNMIELDQEVPTIGGKFYNYGDVTAEMPANIFVNTTESKTLTLYGLVSETGSGIDTLTLTKSNGSFTPTIKYNNTLSDTSTMNEFTGATWNDTKTGATAWRATFNVSGLTTGAIQATVSDVAGNSSSAQIVSLDSDSTAPTLTLSNSDLEDAPFKITEKSPYMNVSGDVHNYTFQGTWSDSGSGTYALYYSVNSTTIGTGTWVAVDSTTAPQSTGTTNWTLTMNLEEGTGKQIAFYAVDKVGNKSSVISKTGITVDYTDPTLTLAPDTVQTYYGVEAENSAVWTITASDNLGTPEVTVEAKKYVDEVESETNGFTYNDSNKKITLANDSSANGVWNITVTATDGAGRKTVKTINTTVDRSKPVFTDTLSITDGDVTKEYALDSWSRNGTLTLNGKIAELGSGLVKVYYKKNPGAGATNLRGNQDGSVGAAGTGAEVEYEITVSGLTSGSTEVGLQAEDAAGNLSEIKRITLNIDKRAPTYGNPRQFYSYEAATGYNQIEGTVLSNGANDMYIVGPYYDENSGIKELKFEIDEVELVEDDCVVKYSTGTINGDATNIGSLIWESYDETKASTYQSYRAMIKKEKFPSGGVVDAKPVDRAGNGSTQLVFTISIDSTPPALTLNTPKTKRLAPTEDGEAVNTVNGTITFAGTTDETAMNSLKLYWGTAQDACNTLLETKNAANSYNWSFDVPLSKVVSNTVKFIDNTSYAGNPKDIYLKLVALDKAGNEASYVYKYSVDPDGDRPIITFTQLDLTGLTANAGTSNVWLKDSKTLSGSVTDDDGVAKLEYKLDSGTWQTLPVTNGNFSYTFATDKKYSMSFRVTDTAGNVAQTPYSFATATSGTQYLSPKFMDKNAYTSSCSILNFAVDSNSPSINNVKYIANNGSDLTSDDFTAKRFGGKWTKFKIRFDATDTNGIESATVLFNGNTVATTKSSDTYTTGYIQLDDLPSGNYNAVITATDKAGREQTTTVSFVVDNDAPTVRIQQPTGLVSTATQALGSLGEANGLDKVYFMVTEHGEDPTEINTIATSGQNAANRWKEFVKDNDAISSFEIGFDSTSGDNHTDQFKWYLSSLGLTTTDAITNGSFTALTTVDLHIKAIDAYGNTGYATKTITVDPQGDKPTVTITYPVADSTLGGTIPIMGTAIDNAGSEGKVGADYVMVLIDMDGDGDYDRDDITALGTMSPVPSWLTWGKFESKTWTDISYASIPASGADWTKYGIKKEVSNASWSFTVNQGGELNPAEGTKNLGLWVYATDGDGNTSQIDLTDNDKTPYVKFKIDKDTPQIANEYLVQYDNGGNVTAKYAYSKDMSIKGVWYYEADMYDDSGISKVTRYKLVDGAVVGDPLEMTSASTSYDSGNITLTSVTTVTVGGVNYTNTVTPGAPVGFHIKMKVGSATDNDVAYQDWKLSYEENKVGTPLFGEREVALNVDNKAPVVIKTGDYYNIRERVTNENGFYTLGTQAKEDPSASGVSQTGVKRIAFYFTRDIGNPDNIHALYDVMKAPGDDGNAIDGYTSLTKEDGLYWKTLTGTASGKTFTLNSSDSNVHTGGLVKINGVIYRIERVNGNIVSIEVNTTATEPFSGVTTAKFAMANVVDNTTEETADESSSKVAGYYTNVNFDDGDIMVESLKKQSTTWTWEANINSKNIGDGSAQLHYVVFDAAGNYTEETVDVFVANNQPRIAGVSIGTDTNGSGEVEAAEMISEGLSGIYDKGKQGNKLVTEAWFPSDKSSSILKILGKTRIIPEIVGGNGRLDYSYAVHEADGAGDWRDSTLVTGSGTNVGTGNGESEEAQELIINLSMLELLNMGNSTGSKFALTIKDQTPGGALTATLNIIVDSLLKDENDPESRILPFYWVNGTKNSLFMESKDYGHIELPNDLPDGFSGTTGILDKDPKLSGIIKLEGIAHDDILLKQLSVTIAGNTYVIGNYNGSWSSTNPWTEGAVPTGTWASRITNATYREAYNMGFIPAEDFVAMDEVMKDNTIDYVSAKYGHMVHWTLYIDTALIGNGTDKVIKTSATDRGKARDNGGNLEYTSNSWTEAEDAGVTANVCDSGTPTGYQRVDVVPYISKITTGLSTLKKSNPSVYDRTAKGHYGVTTNGIINVQGFNITGGTLKFEKTGGGTVTATYNANAGGTGVGGYAIPATAKSGVLSITAGGMESLNNSNNNDAKGSYTGVVNLATNPTGDKTIYDNYYNRQPNGDNNNLLTDDVVLDIWQFKDAGISQTSGYITEPIMKINPKNGMLNFGFNSGPANYCMGDGQTYSYKTWVANYARFSTCGFTVDENGVTHGISVGLDTNPGTSGSAGRLQYFTSKWGRSQLDTNGNYEGANSSRIDNIGAPPGTYNGVTFDGYAFIEDRFASPSLVTAVHGANTYVFLAYYDDLNGQIRFKYGNLSKTTVGTSNTITSDPSGKKGISFEQFADQRRYKLVDGATINDNTHTAFDSNSKPEYYSVIAGPSMTAKAGNYVSIDVIKGDDVASDVIVATWYDATTNKWYYSYKVNPCTDNDLGAGTGSGYWSTPIMLKANAGENCQIAVDKAGGIHIASYDGENADLVYAYLSSYDDATPQVVTVDAYAFTGTNIRLDTAVSDDGEYIIPYIGYYMSSTQKPKMAYLPGVISSSAIKATREAVPIKAGVDETEAVTGLWETGIVPTESRYADNYAYSYVNIGLWKDASTGKAKVMSGTDVTYSNKSGLGQENTSKTYGNGTANPVMAYATRIGTRGHLETAQMK